MSKDIAFFCAVILAIAIGTFVGSAAALSVFNRDEAQNMRHLYQVGADVDPLIDKLFQAANR